MRALGKLIAAKGFKKWPKVQKIAHSGHTAQRRENSWEWELLRRKTFVQALHQKWQIDRTQLYFDRVSSDASYQDVSPEYKAYSARLPMLCKGMTLSEYFISKVKCGPKSRDKWPRIGTGQDIFDKSWRQNFVHIFGLFWKVNHQNRTWKHTFSMSFSTAKRLLHFDTCGQSSILYLNVRSSRLLLSTYF